MSEPKVTLTVRRGVIESAVTALAKMSRDPNETERNRDLAFQHGCVLNDLLRQIR